MLIGTSLSLLELILVTLLLGILAIIVLSKLLDRGGYEWYALRDKVISRLRLVQSRNMNEPAEHCTLLIIEAGRMAHRANSGGCPATIAPIAAATGAGVYGREPHNSCLLGSGSGRYILTCGGRISVPVAVICLWPVHLTWLFA